MTHKLRPVRLLPLASLALGLSGCISFGPKPPPTLMAIHTEASIAPGASIISDDHHSVAVAVPTVEPTLATQRVMVSTGPHAVAYLKGALWAANPAIMMRHVLAETIMARTGRIVPDTRLTTMQPDTRLTGRLVDFGLDSGKDVVMVTFDGAIMKTGSEQIEARRFTASVPVGSEQPEAVGAAIDQAANQVAAQVADWIGTR